MALTAASESSEAFWTALAAIAALLAIPTAIGVGWLAYRAVWPRRKVRWSARVSPLMSHDAADTSVLSVSHTGSVLAKPHVVEVELTNTGNKDLEPSHFNGLPVEITSSVDLVALLQETSKPSVQRVLPATASSDRLSLATPTPLHKGQTLTYVMLIDGQDPKINLQASLTNGTVERHDPPAQADIRKLTRALAFAAAVQVILIPVALVGVLNSWF
jgi:hypothetical protein